MTNEQKGQTAVMGASLLREPAVAVEPDKPKVTSDKVPPDLVVTRGGIPVADQEQGIHDFKAACLRVREPIDCTRDLRLVWRENEAGFNGYDYHTPARVIDTVQREIAHLRARAECMEDWLRVYQRRRT